MGAGASAAIVAALERASPKELQDTFALVSSREKLVRALEASSGQADLISVSDDVFVSRAISDDVSQTTLKLGEIGYVLGITAEGDVQIAFEDPDDPKWVDFKQRQNLGLRKKYPVKTPCPFFAELKSREGRGLMAVSRAFLVQYSQGKEKTLYLPKEDAAGNSLLEAQGEFKWKVVCQGGVCYRSSKDMQDTNDDRATEEGGSIIGLDEGDGWLSVTRVPDQAQFDALVNSTEARGRELKGEVQDLAGQCAGAEAAIEEIQKMADEFLVKYRNFERDRQVELAIMCSKDWDALSENQKRETCQERVKGFLDERGMSRGTPSKMRDGEGVEIYDVADVTSETCAGCFYIVFPKEWNEQFDMVRYEDEQRRMQEEWLQLQPLIDDARVQWNQLHRQMQLKMVDLRDFHIILRGLRPLNRCRVQKFADAPKPTDAKTAALLVVEAGRLGLDVVDEGALDVTASDMPVGGAHEVTSFQRLLALYLNADASKDIQLKAAAAYSTAIGNCTDMTILQVLFHVEQPICFFAKILRQLAKVLPNDLSARRSFCTSGGLRRAQEALVPPPADYVVTCSTTTQDDTDFVQCNSLSGLELCSFNVPRGEPFLPFVAAMVQKEVKISRSSGRLVLVSENGDVLWADSAVPSVKAGSKLHDYIDEINMLYPPQVVAFYAGKCDGSMYSSEEDILKTMASNC